VPAINAFALPGGYIYITRGILAYLEDEAELAGVLGHEIGHVTARHSAQAYTRATGTGIGLAIASIFVPAARPFQGLAETAFGVLFLKHGRDDELQADRLGARYEFEGGWEPRGVPEMLTTLARLEETTDRRGVPNWLATHPDPASRVGEIAPIVKELEAKKTGPMSVKHDEYMRRIDGLVYGDSPEQGIVRGELFLHPPLRFALRFPAGWEINNSETQVVAKEPGNDVYMLLQLVEQPQGSDVEAIASRAMRGAGFNLLQGGRTTINGLDAFTGLYEGSMQGLGRVTTRAAHISHSRQIYVVAGIAKRDVFERYDRSFTGSIESFRGLSRDEADDIRPNRIDLYVVRGGDTWQSIAERVSRGVVKSSTLAIMNDSPVNQQPEAGRRIKVPVPG
jgi:predicted Zn-dependent protease